MQVKLIFFTVFCCMLFMPVAGQQEKSIITFPEKEFSFGTIKETDGAVVHDFRFTNAGKVPLILNQVTSSCGCTVAEWPREPILPGKSGTIRVSFNPDRQSGSINKTIQVNSNAEIPQIVLSVKGVVIPVDRVEEVFKFTIGDIRLQTIYAAFGEIYRGKTAHYSIRVFNNSNTEPATLTFSKVPAHLAVKVIPVIIEPQQEGTIEIDYLSSEVNTWDYVVDRIDFLINGKAVQNNRINITANIKEDFSGLNAEQLAMAAKAEYNSREYDFGTIMPDKTVAHSFVLRNKGKSNLYIRKVSASCGCTAVQPSKTTIVPGDSTEIRAVFDARGREGHQKKAITVITNDPRQSRAILWITAIVGNQAGNANQ